MGLSPELVIDLIVTALFLLGILTLLWDRRTRKSVIGWREAMTGLVVLSVAGISDILMSAAITGREIMPESSKNSIQAALIVLGLGALALGYLTRKNNRPGSARRISHAPLLREQVERAAETASGFAEVVCTLLPQLTMYLGCRATSVRFYSPRTRRWGKLPADHALFTQHTSTRIHSVESLEECGIPGMINITYMGQTLCEMELLFYSSLQHALVGQEVRFTELLLLEELSTRVTTIREWYTSTISEIAQVCAIAESERRSQVELCQRALPIVKRALDARLVECTVESNLEGVFRISVGESERILVERLVGMMPVAAEPYTHSGLRSHFVFDERNAHGGHLFVVWREMPRSVDILLAREIGNRIAQGMASAPNTPRTPSFLEPRLQRIPIGERHGGEEKKVPVRLEGFHIRTETANSARSDHSLQSTT